MLMAGSSYLTNSFALLLAPSFATAIFPAVLVPAFIGKLSLCLWLIVKGVDMRQWQQRVVSRQARSAFDWRCPTRCQGLREGGRAYRSRASRGSNRSRSPSPNRFSPSTENTMAMPGNTASRGAWNSNVCASLSMRPHDGCGGCVPRPR